MLIPDSERAQSTVEFALVCMTLLLFLVGTLDLGRAVYYYDVLGNSVRDGARRGSVLSDTDWNIPGNVPGTYTSAVSYVGTTTIVGATASRAVGMDAAGLQVVVDTPMGTVSGLSLPVTVVAQYVYRPSAGTLLGVGPITITAQSTMRLP